MRPLHDTPGEGPGDQPRPTASPLAPAGLAGAVLAAVRTAPGPRWSVVVRDVDRPGPALVDHRGADVLPTASIGKLLLLLAVAQRLADGTLAADEPLRRRDDLAVADSGLWQHLATDVLPVADVAALVGSVSDNLATNVLLDRVGLAAVAGTGEGLGLPSLALLDRVRDERGPRHPPRLSQGSAQDLSGLVVLLEQARPGTPAARVRGWLGAAVDTSMVAAALGLDPLAHAGADRGLRWWGKTGTDTDVRADVGLVHGPAGRLAYAVCVHGDMTGPGRDRVLVAMRQVGAALRAVVAPGSSDAAAVSARG